MIRLIVASVALLGLAAACSGGAEEAAPPPPPPYTAPVDLLALTVVGVLWPLVLAIPIVLLGGWIGVALLIRAVDLYLRPASSRRTVERSEHVTPPD